jgi:Txe/YoeB family toxin of Txe-Axe toxin-antitoxin module
MSSRRTSRRGSVAKRPTGPWRTHFFRRHRDDDPAEAVPARDFLDACPTKVSATMIAVVHAVASAPPPAFSGGGKWEAMHGKMRGVYEVRVDGPNRHHYRLFCVLERDGGEHGLSGPSLILVAGKDKPFQTKLSEAEYDEVLGLVREFQTRNPRSVLT